MEPTDIIGGLPLKKNATPQQLLVLLLSICALIAFGWISKTYFDAGHKEIIDAIARVTAEQSEKVVAIQKQVDGNSGSIDAIKRYYWSNADQERWAGQLVRVNRLALPALMVPEVPPPPQVPPH